MHGLRHEFPYRSDDPVNLRVLTDALAPDQYEIVTATSGSC
ncbi:hypothetical protein [Paenibacillus macerans]